jgi:hypothetical protein
LVRGWDDFSGEIVNGGVISRLFLVREALRFARHGGAPAGR